MVIIKSGKQENNETKELHVFTKPLCQSSVDANKKTHNDVGGSVASPWVVNFRLLSQSQYLQMSRKIPEKKNFVTDCEHIIYYE